MTKPHSSKRIRQALLALGLQPCSTGCAEGNHELWLDADGHHVKPRFSGKEMEHPHLYSLGESLEVNGICTRRDLMKAVRAR